MRASRRDWWTAACFLFIVVASTVPIFDASRITGYATIIKVTLFEWIKLNLLSLIQPYPTWFIG